MSNKKVSFELGVYLDVEFGECLIQTNTWNKDNAVLRIKSDFLLTQILVSGYKVLLTKDLITSLRNHSLKALGEKGSELVLSYFPKIKIRRI